MRELLKVAYGLNLQNIYFKGLNDHYIEGCEFEPANILESSVFAEIVSVVKEKDFKVQEGKAEPDLLMTIILKVAPDELLARKLKVNGWQRIEIERNPYANL